MQNTNKPIVKNNLKNLIIYGLQEKKAIDIAVMDLRKIKNTVCDFFIVCSGNSSTQTNALKDSVEKEVFQVMGEDPNCVEGQQQGEWILMDYFDIVVHIFRKDKRTFYGLEELWGDAEVTRVTEDISLNKGQAIS